MEKKKITIITSETHEVLVVRRTTDKQIRRWCPLCSLDVDMFTPQGAATMFGTSIREIYRQLEAGKIHFCEEPSLPLLVCGDSFRADLNNRDSHAGPILTSEKESQASDSDGANQQAFEGARMFCEPKQKRSADR